MKWKCSLSLICVVLLSACFESNDLLGHWELENENAVNPIREYSFTKKEMIHTLGLDKVLKYDVSSDRVKVYLTDDEPLIFMIKDKDHMCAVSKFALLLPKGDNCYKRVER